MGILNLTQHTATADQVVAGVVDLSADLRKELSSLLTFNTLPSAQDVQERAEAVRDFVFEKTFTMGAVMIGGAPFFMGALERVLKDEGLQVCYAFSARVSVEKEVDGIVVKTMEFKHLGFVEV